MRQKSKEKREKEETLVFVDPTLKKNAAVPVCILHRRPEHRYASNADDNVN